MCPRAKNRPALELFARLVRCASQPAHYGLSCGGSFLLLQQTMKADAAGQHRNTRKPRKHATRKPNKHPPTCAALRPASASATITAHTPRTRYTVVAARLLLTPCLCCLMLLLLPPAPPDGGLLPLLAGDATPFLITPPAAPLEGCSSACAAAAADADTGADRGAISGSLTATGMAAVSRGAHT